MEHAGEFRKYNVTKKEWVLDGATVLYGPFEDLTRTIEYDLDQERKFSYKGLSQSQIIEHLVRFVSDIWQIHPFPEGNTRTAAVFTINYLRSIGYSVENDMFKSHSWYFRNALVHANSRNAVKGVEPTYEYLILFFRNLLLGENNELRNRYLHIRWDEAKHYDDVSETSMRHNDVSEVGLTENEKAVINVMQRDNHVSLDRIVEITKLSRSTIDRVIRSLKEKGLLERRGTKNYPEWIIKRL